jgi:hypothetical protein
LPKTIEQDIYKVEDIIARKKVDEQLWYLVKWEGFPHEQNTWEPI